MSQIAATVVIPAYRRPDMLRKAVTSVLAQNYPAGEYEVIVVDSSPDEANLRLVREMIPSAPCALRCERKKAEGPGPSRNLGAKLARGRVLAFLDSDCQASPDWLRGGLAAFEDGVGLVQGQTVPEPGVPYGVFNSYIEVREENFLYETANIFYLKQAFEQAGGFQRDLTPNAPKPMGGEDVELAWTVKRAGWKSRFAPEALAMHEVVRQGPFKWMYNRRLFICPRAVGRFPELRRFFFAGYFFDAAHFWLLIALLGIAAAFWTFWALLLVLPYVALRGSQKTRALPGPLRLIRVAIYFPRDLISMAILIAGSVRFRALLL
jgi:cellulose synthase/poly-beta-1,6-N-acetylglucosamine synthase-like glycosyltransferase